MRVREFLAFLNKLYPLERKEIWDPSGLSVKANQNKKFTGAVLAIDITNEVVDFAIENKCNVILTHHPFFFEKTRQLEWIKAPYKKELASKMLQNGISGFAMHTNYDIDIYGTSYQILRYLGWEHFYNYGSPSYSALATVKTSFNDVVARLKNNLNLSEFRTNVEPQNFDKPIEKIAFLSGSGYIGEITQIAQKGIDLIVSSDFKWSDWIVFNQNQIPILEIPHLDEEVFAYHLLELLQAKLPEFKFLLKKTKVPYKNL